MKLKVGSLKRHTKIAKPLPSLIKEKKRERPKSEMKKCEGF